MKTAFTYLWIQPYNMQIKTGCDVGQKSPRQHVRVTCFREVEFSMYQQHKTHQKAQI